MEKNPTINCRNCECPLSENAHFCTNCGQRNTDGRVTFKELFAHFLDNLLNFDNRVFQTIGDLARPGKLTRQFFEGKHIRYYHPVRLFIISGAIFIALLSLVLADSNIKNTDKIWENRREAFYVKNNYYDIDSLSREIKLEMPSTVLTPAFDTLKERFIRKNKITDLDSVLITNAIDFGTGTKKEDRGKMVALDDLMNLNEDSIAVKYNITDFRERMVFIQNMRIQKSVKNFFFYMVGNMLWMIFIMMPMFALALKLLYLRKPFLYIEHLIFSFHTHTFVFLLYSLVLLIYKWTDINLFNWVLLGIGIYLLLAIKRFYKENWWRTVLKFILAIVFYFFVLCGAVVLLTFASVFLF